MTNSGSHLRRMAARGKLRRLARACLHAAPFVFCAACVMACGEAAQEASAFELDLLLSAKSGDAAPGPGREGGAEASEAEAHEGVAAEVNTATAASVTRSCLLEEPRVISLVNPVSVSNYALDTLGIVVSNTPNDACVGELIRDGAQILERSDERVTAFYMNRFDAMLFDFAEKIDVDAIEGRYDFEAKRLVPGIDGQKLDHAATREAFFEAVKAGAASFELVIRETPALSSDVSAYAGFEPSYRIGHYTTKFSRAKNRTVNVKLAASAMNGVFLVPGAEMSYNDWVGERSEARGFKEAPVIEQGQLVEGLGGGACQVSSTIHAAGLLAGLGIEERYNHSLPSSYIPIGMDAVVSYPILDLRIKNTFSAPVVLKVTTKDDNLTAEFFSSEPRPGRVIFRKEVLEELPFRETITVDPTFEPGTIKVRKRGKVGYRVNRGRIFWKDGKETFEKLNADVYQSQPQQTSIAPDVIYPPQEE